MLKLNVKTYINAITFRFLNVPFISLQSFYKLVFTRIAIRLK